MIATRERTEVVTATDVDLTMLDRPANDALEPAYTSFADEVFGNATECAEDARLIKRLALIFIPATVLISLLAQVHAYAA